MTTFVQDSFTDVGGTLITAHQENTPSSGSKALAQSGFATRFGAYPPVISAGGTGVQMNSSGPGVVYYPVAPGSNKYTVSWTYNCNTSNEDARDGLLSCADATAETGYDFELATAAYGEIYIIKWVAGTPSGIGTAVPFSSVAGQAYTMTIDTTAMPTVSGYVQRTNGDWLKSDGTWQSGKVACISAVDATPLSAGYVGFGCYNGGATNYNFTNLVAATSGGGAAIKTVNGIALASVKTVNGIALASLKTWNGITI